MIPVIIHCEKCSGTFEVDSYRKFTICPYCGYKKTFEGFDYKTINWDSSMYSSVDTWTDCPVCRSPNMYLGPTRRKWRCPDCGFVMNDLLLKIGVLWFCDSCETFLNNQEDFTVKSGKWKCSACGFVNDVSKGNII